MADERGLLSRVGSTRFERPTSRASSARATSSRMVLLNDETKHWLEVLVTDSKQDLGLSRVFSSLDVSRVPSSPGSSVVGNKGGDESAANPRRGIVIALVGTLLVTPDALLTRWARVLGANDFALLFWKLLAVGLVLLAYTLVATDNWREAFVRNPTYTMTLAMLQSLTTLGISLGVLLTYAANAMFAYSLDPIWGAFLGWAFLGDVLPPSTIAALVGAFGAMVVMFLPAILEKQGQGTKSTASVAGDLIALASGVSVALYLCLLRYMFLTNKVINAVGASAVGHLACALGVALLGSGILGKSLLVPPLAYVVALLNGCAVSCVVVAFAEAPKDITGAHVGLISLLENIGPIWVFAAFGERPPFWTLIGGAIVLTVIVTHEAIALHDEALLQEQQQDHLDEGEKGGGGKNLTIRTASASHIVASTSQQQQDDDDDDDDDESGEKHNTINDADAVIVEELKTSGTTITV